MVITILASAPEVAARGVNKSLDIQAGATSFHYCTILQFCSPIYHSISTAVFLKIAISLPRHLPVVI
jgi:hypothetical protein